MVIGGSAAAGPVLYSLLKVQSCLKWSLPVADYRLELRDDSANGVGEFCLESKFCLAMRLSSCGIFEVAR